MRSAPRPTYPDFLLVGAQRAQSTYLSACLRNHPQVFLPRDEVPYFEDPFFQTTPHSALAKVFASARAGQRLGIQRPDYLGRGECAANIRTLVPSARILAVLRDPVQRAVSAYFWYMQFDLLPLVPVDVGFDRLLNGWSDPRYPRSHEILEFGFYGRHLTRYVETFGPERVHVVLSGDLGAAATLPGVFAFLGVDPDYGPRPRPRVANAGVYDMRRLRVLRTRRRLAWSWDDVREYRYRSRRVRRPLHFVPNAAIVGFDRLLLARLMGNVLPTLPIDLERRLRARYADDVRTLEGLLSRELPEWRHLRPAQGRPAGPGLGRAGPR